MLLFDATVASLAPKRYNNKKQARGWSTSERD